MIPKKIVITNFWKYDKNCYKHSAKFTEIAKFLDTELFLIINHLNFQIPTALEMDILQKWLKRFSKFYFD